MKRSQFLKALLALPFVPKVLGAEEVVGTVTEIDRDDGVITVDWPSTHDNGTTYYVDPENGDDSKDGLSPETAVRDINEVLPSRHYSITTMKEIDRIWRDCSKKVLEGMKVPWE